LDHARFHPAVDAGCRDAAGLDHDDRRLADDRDAGAGTVDAAGPTAAGSLWAGSDIRGRGPVDHDSPGHRD
jgi:hypothetical protein